MAFFLDRDVENGGVSDERLKDLQKAFRLFRIELIQKQFSCENDNLIKIINAAHTFIFFDTDVKDVDTHNLVGIYLTISLMRHSEINERILLINHCDTEISTEVFIDMFLEAKYDEILEIIKNNEPSNKIFNEVNQMFIIDAEFTEVSV